MLFDNSRIGVAALFVATAAHAQTSQTLSLPPDSPRWDCEGEAKVAEYQGRKALRLDGGAAIVKDFEMRDGVIDVDVATPAKRGFFGFDFRIDNDGSNDEELYLRPHQSGYPDAMQYTPVLNTGRNWQLYNGPGFTGAVDIPKNEWFHLRLEVTGAQAKLYVKDMDKPALVMDRSEDRHAERPGRAHGPVRRNVLLEFRNAHHARRAVGAPSAADACRTR